MTGDHCFVDTNILVYAHDSDAGVRHSISNSLVKELWDAPYPPALSAQVLHELYVTLERKGAETKQCDEIVTAYIGWEVLPMSVTLFLEGLRYRKRYSLSFWDSLIVAAANEAKADVLYTEDLSHGQRYGSARVLNPFVEAGE